MPQSGEQESENADQPWYRIHFPRVSSPSQSNPKFAGARRGFFLLCVCVSFSSTLLTPSHPPPWRGTRCFTPSRAQTNYRTRSGSSPQLRLELQSPRPRLAVLACLARLFLLSPLLKDANPNPTATTGVQSVDAGAGINTRPAHSSL